MLRSMVQARQDVAGERARSLGGAGACPQAERGGRAGALANAQECRKDQTNRVRDVRRWRKGWFAHPKNACS